MKNRAREREKEEGERNKNSSFVEYRGVRERGVKERVGIRRWDFHRAHGKRRIEAVQSTRLFSA
jgi:hypothetical protein